MVVHCCAAPSLASHHATPIWAGDAHFPKRGSILHGIRQRLSLMYEYQPSIVGESSAQTIPVIVGLAGAPVRCEGRLPPYPRGPRSQTNRTPRVSLSRLNEERG